MSFRQATAEDFVGLDAPELMHSSFKNFSYPLGCSISELDTAMGDGDFAFIQSETLVGFTRIKGAFGGIAYLDLHLLADDCEPLVEELLIYLGENYDIGKYYILLLTHEQRELACLEKLNFSEETRLKEHVFIDGEYHDVLMMGSVDYRV